MNCELKDDGEFRFGSSEHSSALPSSAQAPRAPPADAGFICPECMHVAASSEALLHHFQEHNQRAREGIDDGVSSRSESMEVCEEILEECLGQIERRASMEVHFACAGILQELLVAAEHEAVRQRCVSILDRLVEEVAAASEELEPDGESDMRDDIREPQGEIPAATRQILDELIDEVALREEVYAVLCSLIDRVDGGESERARVTAGPDADSIEIEDAAQEVVAEVRALLSSLVDEVEEKHASNSQAVAVEKEQEHVSVHAKFGARTVMANPAAKT